MQPVPWVWALSSRSARELDGGVAVGQQVDRVAARWPPFTSTQVAPRASRASAALRWPARSSTVEAGEPRDLGQVRRDDRRDRQQLGR